jgi:hypothetical protein
MFFISCGWTPPDMLYGITDLYIDPDQGLYAPIWHSGDVHVQKTPFIPFQHRKKTPSHPPSTYFKKKPF